MELRRRAPARQAGVLAAGVAPAAYAQTSVRWRMASSFPKSLDTIFGSAEMFAKTVKALSGGKHTTWQPWPGQHELALRDDAGIILDRIKIEVRGAVVSKDFRKVPESRK